MRVLVITNLYPRPGRETFASFNRQQLRALAAEHELRVIAPIPWTEIIRAGRDGRAAPRSYRNADGLWVDHPTYYFPPKVLRSSYGAFYRASIRKPVEAILPSFRPDVILSCWAHPDGWAAVQVARRAGLPCVIKVIGTDILGAMSARRGHRVAEALSSADGVVAVSRDLADRAIRMGATAPRVHVVNEGVDCSLFRPGSRAEARDRLGVPEGPLVILLVGSPLLAKGGAVLVEACSLLARHGLSFRCYLIGRDAREAELRALIARRGLGDRVALLGPRTHDELPDWYRACDLVALPSFSEGIPNVLRESLASGRPFVASRVGGIPEIADDAYSGLVPPGSPDALAEAIRTILARLPEAERAATEARQIDWDESAGQLAARLQAAIDDHAAGAGRSGPGVGPAATRVR